MLYNQTKTSCGTVMPLLMGCTVPSKIQEETNNVSISYNPITQRTEYNMRAVGTKCVKIQASCVGMVNRPDRKNELDDTKIVK